MTYEAVSTDTDDATKANFFFVKKYSLETSPLVVQNIAAERGKLSKLENTDVCIPCF